jgi:soluble lytic murein transglycosylase-like protein
MPFHFTTGENMLDPDTNARRGMNYFAERLVQTAGDVGKAFAGYNGGHVAAGSSWNNWAAETQRYYVWSTGIYEDAKAGLTASPTLQEWYAAGGASLCQQAASRLNIR